MFRKTIPALVWHAVAYAREAESHDEYIAMQNSAIYHQLQDIASSDDFSKISMVFAGDCPRKVEKCALTACSVKEISFGGKDGVIDLLKTRESHSKEAYKAGPDVWRDLYAAAGQDQPMARLVSGLHYSVSTHIAAFHTPFLGNFISNPYKFAQKCKREHRDNLLFLFSTLRAAVASLVRNKGEIDPQALALAHAIVKNNKKILLMRNKRPEIGGVRDTFASPNQTGDINIDDINIPQSGVGAVNDMIRALACLNCQKCRLWGTIQLRGLRAAIKAINLIPLTKMDTVCLINAFRRASVSVVESQRMSEVSLPVLYLPLIYYYELIALSSSLLAVYLVFRHTKRHRLI